MQSRTWSAVVILLLAFAANASAEPRRVSVRDDRVFLVDGKPFFPIGLYYVGDEIADESGKLLAELHGMGFNHIFYYGEPKREELDRIAASGLGVFFRAPGGLYSAYENMETIVSEYREHPAVLFWEMIDEPVLNGVTVDKCTEGYNRLKKIDADHPVICNQWPTSGTDEQFKQFAAVCDIVCFDYYPIPARQLEGKPNEPEKITPAVMGTFTDKFRAFAPDKPVWVVLQAWSWSPLEYGAEGFPTVAQGRFMAYQVIIHGATGVSYYGQVHVSKPSPGIALPATIDPDPAKAETDFKKCLEMHNAFWASYAEVIRELSSLSPIFTSRNAAVQATTSSPAVETLTKDAAGAPVVLVVNASDVPVEATITHAALAGHAVHRLNSAETVDADASGGFNVTLEPWAARIFAGKSIAEVIESLSAR